MSLFVLFFSRQILTFFGILNIRAMKNDKKVIEIINTFPTDLVGIKAVLRRDHADHILDASTYPHASFLMAIAEPEAVFLNLKLTSNEAVKVVGYNMESSYSIKVAMITSAPYIYCMSVRKYLETDFVIENPVILN